MKRLLSFVFLCIGIVATAYSQIGIGMRDTWYFNIHYSIEQSYYLEIEQSAFSSPLSMQKTRIYAGYTDRLRNIGIKALPYGSLFWNGDFDFGAEIEGIYQIRRFEIYGTVNPHYDNISKLKLRYEAGMKLKVVERAGLAACYTTISPYRTPEKLVECGIWINSGRLGVAPMLAFPIDTPEKYIRVMCNFNYEF